MAAMPREINSDVDPYGTTLVKLIPSELVAAYTALLGLLRVSDSSKPGQLFQEIKIQDKNIIESLLWTILVIITTLTPIYLKRIQGVKSTSQLVFTTGSFLVWAYSLGGIFEFKHLYNPLFGGVILILWTLLVPLVIPTNPPQDP
jgi:hypothetical protein